jgi:signal transduction histidine kinase
VSGAPNTDIVEETGATGQSTDLAVRLAGRLRHASIEQKLFAVVKVTTLAALAIAVFSLTLYDLLRSRSAFYDHRATVADVAAASVVPYLRQPDVEAATRALSALESDPLVWAASVYDTTGHEIASWSRDPARVYAAPEPPALADLPSGFAENLFRPILAGGAPVGIVYVEASWPIGVVSILVYVLTLVGVVTASAIVSLVMLRPLQGLVSRPILDIVRTARRVSDESDFSVRLPKLGQSELNELVDAFNLMLDRVASHEAQLRAALEAADAASRAKTAFLVNMSHELRTPLNGIIGYAEMLCEEAADRGRDDLIPDLERIRHAAGDLLGLINNVLDLRKIEAGRMEFNIEEFSLRALIMKVVDGIQPLAKANDNRISIAVADELNRLTMRSDPVKLGQCLRNLLSNACKFTQRGTVQVLAKRRDQTILIHVTDTGIGMTPAQLSRVFDEFVQAESTTSGRYGGSGLGLTISRKLCRKLGGDITAESRIGSGSTFTIHLPVAPPVEAAAESVEGALAAS